jgi:hypothetical protein
LPQDDRRVFDMLCAADTVGVIEVESRAQMSTLPKLRPRKFYDLVVEAALIRPSPIQGGPVHNYLRCHAGLDKVTYPHELLQLALEKTLGMPLFQEQMMEMAIDAASFSSDQGRRIPPLAVVASRPDESGLRAAPDGYAAATRGVLPPAPGPSTPAGELTGGSSLPGEWLSRPGSYIVRIHWRPRSALFR